MQTAGPACAQRLWVTLLKSHAAAPVNMQWLPVLACWLTSAAAQGLMTDGNGSMRPEASSTTTSAGRVSPRRQHEAPSPKRQGRMEDAYPERTQEAGPGECGWEESGGGCG